MILSLTLPCATAHIFATVHIFVVGNIFINDRPLVKRQAVWFDLNEPYKEISPNTTMKLFSTFIRNKKLPICSKCVHFIEHKNNYPYDPIPSDKLYGRCNQFGEVDLVTGLIEYDFASICRNNDNKCGKFASHYVAK